MIDIKFLRENPEIVKQNIKNKFQDKKIGLVDEVIALDAESRKVKGEADNLRASRNKNSKMIGALMAQGKRDEAEEMKKKVSEDAARLAELEKAEAELSEKVTAIMMNIPNIIDPSVPIGKDDSENVEVERYGDPVVPDFHITERLWNASTVSTLTVPHVLQVTASTTFAVILQDFIQQLSPMQEIL